MFPQQCFLIYLANQGHKTEVTKCSDSTDVSTGQGQERLNEKCLFVDYQCILDLGLSSETDCTEN